MFPRRCRLLLVTIAVLLYLTYYHGLQTSDYDVYHDSDMPVDPRGAPSLLEDAIPGPGTPTRPYRFEQKGEPVAIPGPGQRRVPFQYGQKSPGAVHWRHTPEFFPVAADDLIPLPAGEPVALPRVQFSFGPEAPAEKVQRERRLKAVRKEMEHAWAGYRKYAWMHDEIRPVTRQAKDPFCGWAASMVDSLDTLWIMGMHAEFDEAARAVADVDFTTNERDTIPVFETIIRYLGGLIAAYDVSGGAEGRYPVFLDKAIQLAEVLFGIFDTPNRMPVLYYRWRPDAAGGLPRRASIVSVAELGSMTLEFTRLAQLTGQRKYYDAVARIADALEELQTGRLSKIPGIFPQTLDASGCNITAWEEKLRREEAARQEEEEDEGEAGGEQGKPVREEGPNRAGPPVVDPDSDGPEAGIRDRLRRQASHHHQGRVPTSASGMGAAQNCIPQGLVPTVWGPQSFSMGASQDSAYEYFPKQFVLLGGLEPRYERMHVRVVEAVKASLLFRPMIPDEKRDLRFAAKVDVPRGSDEEFFGYEATHLACFLGGMFGLGGRIFGRDEDVEIAQKLADGCAWAYEAMPHGIMAEAATLVPCEDATSCAWNETRWHRAIDPDWASRDESIVQWDLQRKQRAGGQTRSIFSGAGEKPLSHAEYVADYIRGSNLEPGFASVHQRFYILRPEAVESIWYMYRITGDPKWMDKGWAMFESIVKLTRTPYAHSALRDVTQGNPEQNDSMESFWMAETLKYFYLLFADPDVISLDEWVLNTEAHPFKRPTSKKQSSG